MKKNELKTVRRGRKISFAFGISLVTIWLLILSFETIALGEDWMYYHTDSQFVDLYKTTSLWHPDQDISRIWIMTACADKAKCEEHFKKLIQSHWVSPNYMKWDYGLSLFEANCKSRKYRILISWNLDEDNETIDYFAPEMSQLDWDDLEDEDAVGDIVKIICPAEYI